MTTFIQYKGTDIQLLVPFLLLRSTLVLGTSLDLSFIS
ncbi:hypothetical protein SAMN04487776_1014 [Priestia megaterium]|nr:hypothetical protein SAMN04487776_1014 [Priestia megaterium]